jgi:hypothetical protein
VGHEFVSFADDTCLQEDRVDGACIRKQCEEEHRESRCHDEVGQVDNGLEEPLPLKSERRIREPRSEKKGYNDLGDETHDPHDHRILKVLPDVSVGEKLLVVSESYEVRAYLCEAGTVIFKKAVVDGAAQRNQLEDDIDSNEGNQENVSPSIVANDFPSFDFVHILLRYLF